jgi:CRISPR-associated endoribonuclease Cas6
MRIELTLESPRPQTRLPLNSNHALASCIYRTLATSSSRYAEHLHQEGHRFHGKRFKLFTFSQLRVPRRQVQGEYLLVQSPLLYWMISSPVDDFVMHFANGILARGMVELGDVALRVRAVQALPPPAYTPTMRFTCLSPMTVSTHTDKAGLHPLQYCRLEDGFYDKVVENLRRKYTLLTGHDAGHLSLSMAFDPDYMASRDGRIHKTIRYKDTRIFGYLAPFTVRGDIELIRVGYECGFGDGNSKGLGMVAVGRRNDHGKETSLERRSNEAV